MFKKLSIIQISIISGVLFLVLIVGLLTKTLTANYQSYLHSSDDIARVSLIRTLEQVAHHHAVERGLTAGFLGNPAADKKAKVDAQRQKADDAMRDYNQERRLWNNQQTVTNALNALNAHLLKKDSIRRQVDNRDGKLAFSYYSMLNRLALDAAEAIALETNDNQIVSELNLALYFAKIKERLGQIRGKVNGVLARQSINPVTQQQIAGYGVDVKLLNNYLGIKLAGDTKREFNAQLNNSLTANINATIAALGVESPGFSSLPTSSEWFSQATAQIGEYKKLLDSQLDFIVQTAAKKGASQLRFFWVTSLISFGVIFVILYLNIYLYKTLKRQLNELSANLERIATKGDLTTPVELDSNNELGVISRAIKATIGSIKDLIVGLNSSIGASSRMSNKLDEVTTEILSDANTTQMNSTNIAAAIEQMANTSQEISNSAVNTLEASNQLTKFADHALEINQNSMSAMQALDQSMSSVQSKASAMEQQVNEISGILDTINGLSDQTNLLALNAAIEAARAGEQGRGFAVVADEVRTLAKASRDSSDQISGLLKELQEASHGVTNEVEKSAERTQVSLSSAEKTQEISMQLKEKVGHVEDLSSSVSTAAEQQSVTSNQIAQDINQVLEGATRELEVAKKLRVMFDELELNSATLQRTMNAFKIE